MKKKFSALMAYLRAFKKDEIWFEIELVDGYIEYMDINLDWIPTMEDIFREIVEMNTDRFYDNGPGTCDDPYSYFKVEGHIYPKENKIVFESVNFSCMGTEASGDYHDFNDYSEGDTMYDTFLTVRELLKKYKKDRFVVDYNGGGDSGYVELPPDYPNELEDISYYLLQSYGGWEINEGSQGTIEFTADEIEVNHEWNTEDNYTEDLNIIVTPETFINY